MSEAFVAIMVPSPAREEIERLVGILGPPPLTAPLHITLVPPFALPAGEREEEFVEVLQEAVREFEPFPIVVKEVDVLRRPDKPQTVVVAKVVPSDTLVTLQSRVKQAVCGITQLLEPPVFDYRPHVTLGKFKDDKQALCFSGEMRRHLKEYEFRADAITLLQKTPPNPWKVTCDIPIR